MWCVCLHLRIVSAGTKMSQRIVPRSNLRQTLHPGCCVRCIPCPALSIKFYCYCTWWGKKFNAAKKITDLLFDCILRYSNGVWNVKLSNFAATYWENVSQQFHVHYPHKNANGMSKHASKGVLRKIDQVCAFFQQKAQFLQKIVNNRCEKCFREQLWKICFVNENDARINLSQSPCMQGAGNRLSPRMRDKNSNSVLRYKF